MWPAWPLRDIIGQTFQEGAVTIARHIGYGASLEIAQYPAKKNVGALYRGILQRMNSHSPEFFRSSFGIIILITDEQNFYSFFIDNYHPGNLTSQKHADRIAAGGSDLDAA